MKTFLIGMTMVATLTILCVHPVLAQTDDGYPAETFGDRETTPVVGAVPESWDVGPGSSGDLALSPAPEEPMDSETAPTFGGYTPVRPVSPAEPWMEPPESRYAQPFVSPAAGQMGELPPVGMSHGGFYRPVR
jgi:hypothetical protein